MVAVAVAGSVFGLALPRFASATEVWHALGHVGWDGAALLAAVTAWNVVTYWLVWMAAVPGLGPWRAALVSHAPTAVANTVPAGSYVAVGLTYTMLRSWGQDRSEATLAMVVTGIWNNFAKLGLPVVALAGLVIDGGVDGPRVVAAGLGLSGIVGAIAGFGATMRSDAAASRMARVAAVVATPLLSAVGRPPPHDWEEGVRRFRTEAGSLVAGRWHVLTASTLVGHLALFLVLLASLRTAGVRPADVAAVEALAVFAFARLATAVPFSPGGLGVVELALTTGLVAAGGGRGPVVAAVLVYRALTYLLQIPMGGAAYVLWRRSERTELTPTAEP